MYIILTWRVLDATPPADVRAEVMREIADAGFLNTREVMEQHVLANMAKGKGSGTAFALEGSLRDKAGGRYSFTLYYLRRGDVILHSDDLPDQPLVRIADFAG